MKNTTSYITIILLVLLTIELKAQHKPQYTQYLQNNYLLNPAITGVERYADVKIGYRNQWRHLEGSPTTYYISAHTPYYTKRNRNKRPMPRRLNNPYEISNERMNNVYDLEDIVSHSGVGAIVSSDRLGSFSRYSGELSYAYHQKLYRDVHASVGFSAGYIYERLETSRIDMVDQEALLQYNDLNSGSFDISSGILLYGNYFYLGVAACQLYKDDHHYLSSRIDNSSIRNMNYFITGALRLNVNRNFALVPAAAVKYRKAIRPSYDLSLKSCYKSRYWAGFAYREGGALSAFVGISILPYLEIGYSYDYGVNNLDMFSHGSSEIVVGLKLNSKQKVHCPIYF